MYTHILTHINANKYTFIESFYSYTILKQYLCIGNIGSIFSAYFPPYFPLNFALNVL